MKNTLAHEIVNNFRGICNFEISYKLTDDAKLIMVHLNQHKQLLFKIGKGGWCQVYTCIDFVPVGKAEKKVRTWDALASIGVIDKILWNATIELA